MIEAAATSINATVKGLVVYLDNCWVIGELAERALGLLSGGVNYMTEGNRVIVTSDDYKNLVQLMAPMVIRFVERVRTECELHITGADDDDVLHAAVDKNYSLQDLIGLDMDSPLTACFPVTVTLTGGHDSMEWTISLDEMKH